MAKEYILPGIELKPQENLTITVGAHPFLPALLYTPLQKQVDGSRGATSPQLSHGTLRHDSSRIQDNW